MRILLVDDDPSSLFLISEMLRDEDYEILTATNGVEAKEFFEEEDIPEIVLSDWVMPDMDGLALCRYVKARSDAPYTCFILLTQRTEKSDLATGLDAGADDFIRKPVDAQELRSRLAAGERVVRLARKVRHYANKMESLAEERAHQLIHSERLALLGQLSAGIAHEINNNLAAISGEAQILGKLWQRLREGAGEVLDGIGKENRQVAHANSEITNTVDCLLEGVSRICEIVSELRRFSRKDNEKLAPCNLNQCITESLAIAHGRLKNRVNVETELCEDLPLIRANSQRIEQVLVNLYINAAHAMEKNNGGTLRITSNQKDNQVVIMVEDSGPGIPEDKLEKIWQPFFTTKSGNDGTGLGLSISKGIMDEHQGSIYVENRAGAGACFILEFPLQQQVDEKTLSS